MSKVLKRTFESKQTGADTGYLMKFTMCSYHADRVRVIK
jgi:hypothetical protein